MYFLIIIVIKYVSILILHLLLLNVKLFDVFGELTLKEPILVDLMDSLVQFIVIYFLLDCFF
jgi:hypothetical protein